MSCCTQRWTTSLQYLRSAAAPLMLVIVRPVQCAMLSTHICLGRPLGLLPSTLPSINLLCNVSCLCRCPKYFNFRVLIMFVIFALKFNLSIVLSHLLFSRSMIFSTSFCRTTSQLILIFSSSRLRWSMFPLRKIKSATHSIGVFLLWFLY